MQEEANSEANSEAQPVVKAPETDVTPLAAVAKLLRENPTTLGESAPEARRADQDEAQERGELPAAGEGEGDDEPKFSEEGLGIEPAESGDAVVMPLLETLAEKAGLTMDEIYKFEVKLGDGLEPTTLGALKDQFQNYSKLEVKTEAFETSRTEFENNMIRSRGELAEIVSLLPEGSITDALVQQATRQYAETRTMELEALVKIKPEWADPTAYALAQSEILETASEYGFKRSDLNAVIDHRLIKLLHDFHTMRKRFSEANAGAKRVLDTSRQKRAKTTRGAPDKGLKDMLKQAKESPNVADKVAAVNALLGRNQGA